MQALQTARRKWQGDYKNKFQNFKNRSTLIYLIPFHMDVAQRRASSNALRHITCEIHLGIIATVVCLGAAAL